MDPMAEFTKEDWGAIEGQRQHEAEMSAILSIKKDIDKKLNEMKLNQELEFNVKSVIAEYYPEEYKNHGDVLIYKTIEFIKKNCQLSIANDKDAIRTATKIAINHFDLDKIVDARDILAIYEDLKPSYRDLSNLYYNNRNILFDNPKIINYIYGTRINEKTSIKRQFEIHEEIINGLHEMDNSRIENCPNDYKEIIKYVLQALKNIRVIENSNYPEVKHMVQNYNSIYDPTIVDESKILVVRK